MSRTQKPDRSGHDPDPTTLDRRELLRLGAAGLSLAALGGAAGCGPDPRDGAAHRTGDGALTSPGPALPLAAPPMDRVRVGFVGVGLQGGSHVQNFLRIDDVEIHAVCDVDLARRDEVAAWVTEAGQAAPALYGDTETDFERMCAEEELDLVFNATPWEWHVPVCLAAMENGKHAATSIAPTPSCIQPCRLTMARSRGKGEISAARPRIRPVSQIIEPTALPSANSARP